MNKRSLEYDAEGAARRIVEKLQGRTLQHAVRVMDEVELALVTGRLPQTEDESTLASALSGMATGSALYAIRIARSKLKEKPTSASAGAVA